MVVFLNIVVIFIKVLILLFELNVGNFCVSIEKSMILVDYILIVDFY